MNEVFQVKPSTPYSLRDKNELYGRNFKTVTHGTESISFLAHKIWPIVPQEIENCKTLDFFLKKHKEMETNLPMSVI